MQLRSMMLNQNIFLTFAFVMTWCYKLCFILYAQCLSNFSSLLPISCWLNACFVWQTKTAY